MLTIEILSWEKPERVMDIAAWKAISASDEYWCPVCDDHVRVDHVSGVSRI